MLRVTEGGARRRERYVESYRQLGRTLLDLQRAADLVFDEISQRAAEERDKLSEISHRIQAAKARIEEISHSDHPLTVVSPARHPSSGGKKDEFRPLFGYKYEGSDLEFPVANVLVNGGLTREFGTDGTMELFQFFSEEDSGYPLKESDLKGRANFAQPNYDISQENLSIRARSTLAPKSDTKGEQLPPPPPSLLPKNFKLPQRSEDFKFRPARPIKHQNPVDDHSDATSTNLAITGNNSAT